MGAPNTTAVSGGERDGEGAADALPPVRAPRLVLIVTGMGMRGKVENDLRQRVERMFSPPVPVVVHRYGVARSGSVFRPCQRAATLRVTALLRGLSPRHDGARGPVDVIAHSFGAWMVGQALRENPDIRVGRIVMAGSVLRPDYDWSTVMARGQVEAVLNHYGSRDLWAFVSEFFIPDSGPAGYRGFGRCAGVFNRPEPGFRHHDFFESSHIDAVHRTLWRPFLTRTAEELPAVAGPDISQAWRQRSWLLRANLLRALLLVCLTAGTAELLLAGTRLLTSLVT